MVQKCLLNKRDPTSTAADLLDEFNFCRLVRQAVSFVQLYVHNVKNSTHDMCLKVCQIERAQSTHFEFLSRIKG